MTQGQVDLVDAGGDQEAIMTPVLVYVPGLGPSPVNTGDGVAVSLAASMSRELPGRYEAQEAEKGVQAPAGLKVSKTIHDPDGQPALQVFEFDYASTLMPTRKSSPASPVVVSGAFRASVYAFLGFLWLIPAWGRRSKSLKTKLQLTIGLVCCLVLAAAAFFAVVALFIAAGWDPPKWFNNFAGEDPADWKLGVPALGLTVGWPFARKRLLGLAAVVEACIRFVDNHDGVADDIAVSLDDALERLYHSGWKGPVHLLGYSFGSLVVFEAMLPRQSAMRGNEPEYTVTSMITVGCPLDMVRLFKGGYTKTPREPRVKDLAWTNVFNRADVFGSNLIDKSDKAEGTGSVTIGDVEPVSLMFSDEKIALPRFMATLRMHSLYWGEEKHNCFGKIVPRLVVQGVATA